MSKQKDTVNSPAILSSPMTDQARRRLLIAGAGGIGALALSALGCETPQTPAPKNTTSNTPAPANTPVAVSTPAAVAAAAASLPPLKPATYPADRKNALRAADEIIAHYTLVLNTPSSIIHAVRAFGKGFNLADGSNAVSHLCTYYASEREIKGQKYVYFPRQWEVHENSFLKTFLEAGVSPDQPITVGSNRYTLKQFGDHSKASFRCDVNDLNKDAYIQDGKEQKYYYEHLPWGLIAFSKLSPPENPSWTNAYGETIQLDAIIDRAVATHQTECEGIVQAVVANQDEPEKFRVAMREHSCYAMHAMYGFLSCLKNGYRNNNLNDRLKELLDVTIHRLEGDAEALDREFAEAGRKTAAGGSEAQLQKMGLSVALLTEAFRLRGQIKLLGHGFEAINFALLHKLFTLTPEQKRRTQAAEQKMYEHLVKLRAMDLEPFRNLEKNGKFVNDIVIALGHAARGMKLLTPDNPDNAPVNTARK